MEQFVGAAATLGATLVGGALVIFANSLTERRKDQREQFEREARNAALMTALFFIRNFLAEVTNAVEPTRRGFRQALPHLKAAQKNLDAIVTKSPPEVQYIMATVFEVSLRLDDYVAAVESRAALSDIVPRHDALQDALDSYDLYTGNDLAMMSPDEIRAIVANPEDVPD
ncbi:MAG: hypothetical protein ABIR08_12045 [Sphingomonas sp.]